MNIEYAMPYDFGKGFLPNQLSSEEDEHNFLRTVHRQRTLSFSGHVVQQGTLDGELFLWTEQHQRLIYLSELTRETPYLSADFYTEHLHNAEPELIECLKRPTFCQTSVWRHPSHAELKGLPIQVMRSFLVNYKQNLITDTMQSTSARHAWLKAFHPGPLMHGQGYYLYALHCGKRQPSANGFRLPVVNGSLITTDTEFHFLYSDRNVESAKNYRALAVRY